MELAAKRLLTTVADENFCLIKGLASTLSNSWHLVGGGLNGGFFVEILSLIQNMADLCVKWLLFEELFRFLELLKLNSSWIFKDRPIFLWRLAFIILIHTFEILSWFPKISVDFA